MSVNDHNLPVVTIDGPAGSGKGTIAQAVAERLGWNLLDSGALYRLVALAALINDVSVNNETLLEEIAKNLDVKFKPSEKDEVQIYLEGQNVTREIRTEECGNTASKVAAIKGVRKALLERQREFLQAPGLVADGRDMGTVVFPHAGVKIFLTASAEVRADRRMKQLKEKGINANLRGLIRDIEERDARDCNRKDSPLVPASDAIMVDTDHLSINEVVDIVMDAIRKVY